MKRFLPFLKNNVLFSGISYGFRLVINIVVFAVLARYFPVDTFGLIAFFVMIITVMSTVIDFGHRLIIVKELSVDRSLLNEAYVANKLALKFGVVLLASTIFLGYAALKDFWGYGLIPMISLIFSAVALTMSNFIFAVFQSFGRYQDETTSLAVMAVLLVSATILSRNPQGDVWFVFGYAIATAAMLGCAVYLLQRNVRLLSLKKILECISLPSLRSEFLLALPFASIIAIEAFAMNYDTFFVENYCTAEELGLYGGVKKIIAGLTILAIITVSAVMPVISRLTASEDTRRSILQVLKVFFGVLVLGMIIFGTYFAFNRQIILLLLGPKFLEIAEWDAYIALLTLIIYAKVIPGIYFITASFEKTRLGLVILTLLLGISYLFTKVPGHSIKTAMRAVTEVKVFAASIYVLVFLLTLTLVWIKSGRAEKTLG
ncbi:MAG: oligosaccharide flippase family protein [Saprospiraceae bacterium]|nr:oligosaccharide flippase family protein [Saprospiraceae bacterium]